MLRSVLLPLGFARGLRGIVDYPPFLDRIRWLIEAGHRGERKVIRRELGGFKGKILDLPCGTGIFSSHFDDGAYTGVDLGEKYVARARKKFSGKTFLVGDALALDFPEAVFDAILVIGFLHHLEDADVRKALLEMRRVLRPGGMLLLIEDVPTRSRWNVPGRFLQKLDQGGRIRDALFYERGLSDTGYSLLRSYPMRAGLWDYTVFVLRR